MTVDSENVIYHSDNNCLIEIATKTLIFGCENSVIPSDGSVTSIGENAFCDYSGLTSVTIPDSVTSIGAWAFFRCSGLNEIKFSGTMDEWNAIDKADNWHLETPVTQVICSDGEVKIVNGI